MQNYKVNYKTKEFDDAVTHVSATNREAALYAAFDEALDKGYAVTEFGDVMMFDESSETWVLTHSHRAVSALVK